MRNFQDMPLLVKVCVAPAIVLIALVVMAGFAISNANTQEQAARRLDGQVFERLRLAMELKDSVTLAHARLFAMISSAANETDQQKLDAAAKALLPELDANLGVAQRLEQQLADDPGVHERAKSALATLQEYTSGAKQAVDLAAVDAGYAIIMTGDANQKFGVLRELLDLLNKDLQERRVTIVSAMLAGMKEQRQAFIIGLIVATLLSLAAAWTSARGITTPVLRLTKVMDVLAKGNAKIEVPDRNRRDEVGAMAKAVQVFKDNAVAKAELEAKQAAEQRQKEARQQAIERHIAAFEQSIKESIHTLGAAASGMRETAQTMSSIAEETSRQSAAAASAALEASANVQTVAAASEEISTSIAEIGRQVAQSNDIAGKAVDEAKAVDTTVESLDESARRIGEIVQLIQAIASQTNLLALNATIEAARAGEAGKGFAVVAGEVKSLANQTAKATEDIAAQIGAIQGASTSAVAAIRGIGSTINRVNEISTAIAAAVEEQGAATAEITRNTQEAARGTSQVSENVGGVSQAAGETGTAATQVLAAADRLGQQAEVLRRDIDQFLANIRAA